MPCSCGAFSFVGLAGLTAIGLGYPGHELSFKRTNQLNIPMSVDVVLNDKFGNQDLRFGLVIIKTFPMMPVVGSAGNFGKGIVEISLADFVSIPSPIRI